MGSTRSYLSQMLEHFLLHWLSGRNVCILCYCLCRQHKRPMLWWRRENLNFWNTNVKVIWFSTALHPSFCLWEWWLLIGSLQRLVGGMQSAPQLPGTVETTLLPAGGDWNPKPLCWKWPNPDTLGGNETRNIWELLFYCNRFHLLHGNCLFKYWGNV